MSKLSVKKCCRVSVFLGVMGAIALLVVPVFAQYNTEEEEANVEAESLFQPSMVLDSPKRSGGNIAETLAREAEFKTLLSMFNVSGNLAMIEQGGEGSLTIFAPTNTAFQKNSSTYAKLLEPQNKDKLIRVLKYHVISGEITGEKVNSGEVETLEGSKVQIQVTSQGVIIGGAKGIQPSIEASNGVIVRIDNLLLPPDLGLF